MAIQLLLSAIISFFIDDVGVNFFNWGALTNSYLSKKNNAIVINSILTLLLPAYHYRHWKSQHIWATIIIINLASLSICVPLRKTSMAASRSFSSVAPKIWNALPGHLSSIPTLPAFRRALKHHFFLSAYPDSRTSGGITLRDTTPPAAIVLIENTMPSS